MMVLGGGTSGWYGSSTWICGTGPTSTSHTPSVGAALTRSASPRHRPSLCSAPTTSPSSGKDASELSRDPIFIVLLSKTEVMNLLESADFSCSNPYYVVQQGKVTSTHLFILIQFLY
jgi:hypothetical protein